MSTALEHDRPTTPKPIYRESPPVQERVNEGSGFCVSWATSEADVHAAQALRYQAFVAEFDSSLPRSAFDLEKRDVDRFDSFCDHLLVRVPAKPGEEQGLLVGTYRVLPPDAARKAGGLYAESEFDLGPLQSLRASAVELGRSCVRPGWRSGGVVLALWAALCAYMAEKNLDTMIGCASISMVDGGSLAEEIWHSLKSTYLVDERWRIVPRHALPLALDAYTPEGVRHFPLGTPPLIKGYLRCGARLLGPPAVDPVFNTADLPIMLRLDQLNPRYRKHFFRVR